MKFAFDDEQEELRRTVRGFLTGKSPSTEVRRLMETEEGYDPAVWEQLTGQLGLAGLAIPEEYGGAGYGFLEVVIVLEEMGRVLLAAPYFSTVVLAAGALLHSDDEAARKDYLPGIASGDLIATLAFTEDDGRWDTDATTLAAVPDQDGWRLTGHKTFVLDGCVADLVIVAARTPGGVTLFAVQADAPGLHRTPLETMDQVRKQARLEFDAVPARLIGTEGAGGPVLGRVLDLAAAALAAEQIGGAQRVLEMAVQYAGIRTQFGRPIGAFQAVKHKCADMLVAVESARSAAYYAGWAAAELNAELPVAACLAKVSCSEAFYLAASDNIQILGGIGFTWEHDAHLYFKRAKSSELFLGSPTYHRELLAQRINL